MNIDKLECHQYTIYNSNKCGIRHTHTHIHRHACTHMHRQDRHHTYASMHTQRPTHTHIHTECSYTHTYRQTDTDVHWGVTLFAYMMDVCHYEYSKIKCKNIKLILNIVFALTLDVEHIAKQSM